MVDARTIKFASDWERNNFKGGGGVGLGFYALLQVLCRLGNALALLVATGRMAGRNPFSREVNHGGHLPRRLEGDRGARSSGVEEAEERENGQGDDDPGKKWF